MCTGMGAGFVVCLNSGINHCKALQLESPASLHLSSLNGYCTYLTFTFAKCLQMSLWMQVQFMLATSKLKTDRAVDSGELIQTLGLLEAVLWSVL